jgi:trehalose 6-phosphate synthase
MRMRSFRRHDHFPFDTPRQPAPATADRSLIVLANRAPFSHNRLPGGDVTATRSASGLVTALEPLLEAHSGTWVAHGSGDADMEVVDGADGLGVESDAAHYRLRYVWLTAEELRGYYYGFANEGLWPLCHDVGVEPVFRGCDFAAYQAVNQRFVNAVVQEATRDDTVVLVQDYHFALAPRLLRRRQPSSTVVTFWHIPWPTPEVFGTCPWAPRLLDGLLGSDILGFQTDQDCLNFMRCAQSVLDGDADRTSGTVTYRRRTTQVRAYPVGVDWDAAAARTAAPAPACRERVCRELGLPSDVSLALGVDRLDYTKGIPQKFLAIERLLEDHPELRGRIAFLQVAEPSRGSLPEYREIRRRVLETRDRVNRRFGDERLAPIRLLEGHYAADAVYRFYKAADACYVGSLRDGMNLVAKEFVSARNDERGALVLSAFTGAARQLQSALLVDPDDITGAARALHRALTMPDREQATRMRALRSVVRTFSAQWWADQLLEDARRERSRTAAVAAQSVPAAAQIPA